MILSAVNFDWGLIVVACMAGAIGALIGSGLTAWVMVGRALTKELDHMEAEYEALHQHVHSTLGLKPPKGNT